IGPTSKTLTIGTDDDPAKRNASFDQMVAIYTEQIGALVEGGVDILLPETSFDTLIFKACLFAIDQYFTEHNVRLPVMLSGTIFPWGTTLSSQKPEAFLYSVGHFDALSIGLNCSVGIDKMRPDIELLAKLSKKPISCYPNAGMPDGFGGFDGTK